MKKVILGLMLTTIGCTTIDQERSKFYSIINECDSTSVNKNYGKCVESNLDEHIPRWKTDRDSPYIKAYIEWLNAAGDRVAKGEMTEQEARTGARQLMSRLRSQAQSANYSGGGSGFDAFFAGLAIMQMANPVYRYAPPPTTTTYTYPGMRPISCTSIGNIVSCI